MQIYVNNFSVVRARNFYLVWACVILSYTRQADLTSRRFPGKDLRRVIKTVN